MSLQDLLGTQLPLIQAPMAGVQLHSLAAAVSNAGALGSLPCAMLDAAGLRKELLALREHTRKPYNLNFFCHQPPAPDAERDARWKQALESYYSEVGADFAAPLAHQAPQRRHRRQLHGAGRKGRRDRPDQRLHRR